MNNPVAIPEVVKKDINGIFAIRELILQKLAEGVLREVGNQDAVLVCLRKQAQLFEEMRDRYGRQVANEAYYYAVDAVELGAMPEELAV